MDALQYVDRGSSVILYRMYTGGTEAEIPERIGTKPVTEVADHAFSDEPSVLYRPQEIRTALFRNGEWQPETCSPETNGVPALAGKRLTRVLFPDTLTAAGSYAFYGCGHLTDVEFPRVLSRIGSGLFNSCPNLRRLYFVSPDERPDSTPPFLQEILQTISHETEIIVCRTDHEELYRLVFPEFYEEPKENTPARIIEIIWHGTGYQYRQCFLDRRLQFDAYDALLPMAQAQETPETLVRLCLDRLKHPVRLTGGHRDAYVSCLRGMPGPLWDLIFRDTDTDLTSWLRILELSGFYTLPLTERLLKLSEDSGRADATAYLMNLRHRLRPRPERKYTFD